MRRECELRALEALRQQVDKERERWYEERWRWDEWRKEVEGEKCELLHTIKELRGLETTHTTPEKERSPSSSGSSSSREGDSNESVPPQEGARESVADSVGVPSITVASSQGVEPSIITTGMVVHVLLPPLRCPRPLPVLFPGLLWPSQ